MLAVSVKVPYAPLLYPSLSAVRPPSTPHSPVTFSVTDAVKVISLAVYVSLVTDTSMAGVFGSLSWSAITLSEISFFSASACIVTSGVVISGMVIRPVSTSSP